MNSSKDIEQENQVPSFAGNAPQQQRPQTAATFSSNPQQKIGGGISSNSFRQRIQGFNNKDASGAGTIPSAAQTTTPAGPQAAGAASNKDLQKRLADMKAKLQGLKKS